MASPRLRISDNGTIQQSRDGYDGWEDLFPVQPLHSLVVGQDGLPGIKGEDGRAVELQKSLTHIQWRYAGDIAWTNLVALSDITGPAGSGGGGGSHTHTQGVPASVWNINHGLGFKPNVTVIDSADEKAEGEIDYIDDNNITITFSAGFSGFAYLS